MTRQQRWPPHEGSPVRIRALDRSDLDMLSAWSTDPLTGFRWRFGGATPSPAQFIEALWDGVLCQFIAVDASGEPCGLVVGYGADHVNGHAYFAVLGKPAASSGGAAMVGMLKLIDHMFRNWPFRVLYCEVPDYNMVQFHSAIRKHMSIEGRLRQHVYHDGEYHDLHIGALHRSDWFAEVRPRFAGRLDADAEPASRSDSSVLGTVGNAN